MFNDDHENEERENGEHHDADGVISLSDSDVLNYHDSSDQETGSTDDDQTGRNENEASLSINGELNYLLSFNERILNLIPDGVAVLDVDLRPRTANLRFCELLNLEPTDDGAYPTLADHPFFEGYLSGDQPYSGNTLANRLAEMFEKNEDNSLSVNSFSMNGDEESPYSHCSILASAWDTGDRDNRRIILWVRPISNHVKKETGSTSGITESEVISAAPSNPATLLSFSQGLFKDLPIGVCEMTSNLNLRRVNGSLKRIFGHGYETDTPGEEHIFSIYPELCDDEILNVLENCVKNHEPVSGRTSIERDSGERIELTLEALPVTSSDGTEESIFLFLQPDRNDVYQSETGTTLAAAQTEQAATDTVNPLDYPEFDESDMDPVNEEVGHLLTALDLILDFDRLCNRILDMALEMTGGRSGSLMLLQEENRELTIAVSRGLSDPVAKRVRQRLGEGIAGRVAERGEPLLLQGRIGDKRFKGVGGRPEVCSSVVVPVTSDRKVLAVLSINSDPDVPAFDSDKLRKVAMLGCQVGGALERSRQLRKMQQRSHELTVRAEIESIKFAEGTLETKLQLIAERIASIIDIDLCSIFLKDAARESVTLHASSGLTVISDGAVTVPIGTGLVGWVAKHRKPIVMRGISDYDEGENTEPPPMSVGIPIIDRSDLTGVIYLEASSRDEIDDNDMDLVTGIASAIGMLIGDVRTQQSSSKKLTMLSALGEMATAFTAARDRHALARLVAFCGATVLESDVSTVRLTKDGIGAIHSGDGIEKLELLATHGTAPPKEDEALGRLEALMIAEVLERCEPCRAQDLPEKNLGNLMSEANVSAVMGVPLLAGDDRFGVIVIYRVSVPNCEIPPFGDQEVEIGTRLGDYAGAAASQFIYWTQATREEDLEEAGV